MDYNDLLEMDEDGRNYIINYAEQYQSSRIISKNAETNTKCSYIWTYRSTGCDVISILTTTVPIKNGKMKDIKVHNKEMRRIKPPIQGKRFGSGISGNPLEEQVLDAESTKRKMCHILKEEKKQFMSKLKISRYVRSTIETSAAVCIQRFYRGYTTRKYKEKFYTSLQVTKDIRSTLRNYLMDAMPNTDIILTWAEHRENYTYKRNYNANVIQCAYRCYLSRKCLRRKRIDYLVICRRKAAILIQKLARNRASKDRVKLLKYQRKTLRLSKSVIVMQRTVRKYLAVRKVHRRRYKLHWVAARMIQCWFRSHKSRQMSIEWKQMTVIMKQYNQCRKIQCMVRKFLSKRRVNRIRYRRLWLFTFNTVSRIQKIIRSFVCKARVRKIKDLNAQRRKTIVPFNKGNDEEDDIFELALSRRSMSASSIVDMFFKKTYSPNKTDNNGNTLIHIASQSNNIELITKCANLGFDINQKNKDGLTPLMTSIKYGHLDIAQFFVKSSEGLFDSPLSELREDDGIKLVNDIIMTEMTEVKIMELLQFIFSKQIPLEGDYSKLQDAALLAVCTKGNIEVYNFLMQLGQNTNPEITQSCIFNASGSSVQLLMKLLEIESIDNIDATKADILFNKDSDSKDCLLLASLSGKIDLLEFVENILAKGSNARVIDNNINWNMKDFMKIASLIIDGNDRCLKYIFDYKIDLNKTLSEMDNATLPIIASKNGKIEMLDVFLNLKADFSLQDGSGRTVFHYMTERGKDVSQLLLHENAKACNINEHLLALADNNGDTPIHIAATKGLIVTVDLLAGKGMDAAMSTKNKLGLTPLLIACSTINCELIKNYINLGADVKACDIDGRNALWHLYHPQESVVRSGRRTVAGEYYTKKSTAAPTKAERQAESTRLAGDIEIIQLLIKAGCPLYPMTRNIANLLELKSSSREKVVGRSAKITRSSLCDLTQFNLADLEAGDIAILELSFILLKELPPILSPDDLWNLTLSSIIFDDGTAKCFQSLLESGADKKLAEKFGSLPEATPNPANILQYVIFDGMTVLGWAIRSANNSVVQQLIKKNYNPTLAVDNLGNNGLHFAASYGQGSTVDMILGYEGDMVRIEQLNNQKLTPVMMASIAGNYHSMKRLMAYGGDLRRGLEKKYWGWLLVLARKQEKNQKNCQWGRTGDDDERYFSISKDPFFTIWYKGTLPNIPNK